MPLNKSPFPHLRLVLRDHGKARFPSFNPKQNPRTEAARQDKVSHSAGLMTSAGTATTSWKLRVSDREDQNLPVLPKNIPLMLEVDPTLDLDELSKLFNFELIAEHEDGFVIVASEDIDLSLFAAKLRDFAGGTNGAASVAKIHGLLQDADQSGRVARILSEYLSQLWDKIRGDEEYIVDVGVSCLGTIKIPTRPGNPNRGPRESERRWAARQADYAAKMSEWNRGRESAYSAWARLADDRKTELFDFVSRHNADVLDGGEDELPDAILDDSFTIRLKIKGRGLRDLVLNYPYIFEVTEPDDVELPQTSREAAAREREARTLNPPGDDAPAVCVIDSGIQQEHDLLGPAIDSSSSRSFLPGDSSVADHYRPAGHGTRVAGAVLYGENIPKSGVHDLSWWIQNARVLDEKGHMPYGVFPPAVLREIVGHFHGGPKRTRIFNHSITSAATCRLRHMSAWAAEIDRLSHHHDVLFLVSSGNLSTSSSKAWRLGIAEHIQAGRPYPDYLCEPASRIANPGQSLQALTVGSISYREFEEPDWRSLARGEGHPSAFSRSGPGIWDSIKPEVVELGGDNLVSPGSPATVGTPPHASGCYPELVRSTMYGAGPAYGRDAVGTSYSAPKVARIAARLQQIMPEASCLLYRALIVQSARWPDWTREATQDDRARIVRWIGYGVPNIDRATSNSPYRSTLITGGERAVKSGDCHVYQVPIPPELRRPGDDYVVLVEVTLSFSAEPRRTRRERARYYSTWADWKCSSPGEPLNAFRLRALKTEEKAVKSGPSFEWYIRNNTAQGAVRGVSRSAGSVQKDWAYVRSNALPEDFCIAVVGHKGWSKDPDAQARYALTVSIEVVGKEIPLYEPIRNSVEALRLEIEAETQVEIEVLG